MEISALNGSVSPVALDQSPSNRKTTPVESADDNKEKESTPAAPPDASEAIEKQELSESESRKLRELKQADREVKAHEQAHKAAAGQYARGGPSYVYERGPDGRLYAVGGEVSLDVSEIPNDPEATIRKMQQVRRAALAPRDPSPQDRRVAAEATAREAAARREAASTKEQEQMDFSSDPLNVPLTRVAKYGYSHMFPIQRLLNTLA